MKRLGGQPALGLIAALLLGSLGCAAPSRVQPTPRPSPAASYAAAQQSQADTLRAYAQAAAVLQGFVDSQTQLRTTVLAQQRLRLVEDLAAEMAALEQLRNVEHRAGAAWLQQQQEPNARRELAVLLFETAAGTPNANQLAKLAAISGSEDTVAAITRRVWHQQRVTGQVASLLGTPVAAPGPALPEPKAVSPVVSAVGARAIDSRL